MVVAPKRLPVPMPNPPAHQALPAQDGTIENIDRQTAVPPRPARGFLLPGRFKYDITVSTFSDKETDDPLHADRRNFYKVEEWSRDGLRVELMLYAGNNLNKARRIFERTTTHRPCTRLTIRQRMRGGESRLGGIARTLLWFACRGFPLFATVRENGCFKPSLGHLYEDALLPIARRSLCPVYAFVRELPILPRRHDAAPIRAMSCRISGELFASRTVKIKRGHARPEPSSCVAICQAAGAAEAASGLGWSLTLRH
jgi:hypothetical protein